EVAERSNAAVLKTVEPKGSGGSNPSLSANKKWAPRAHFLLAKRECGRALRVRQIGRTADLHGGAQRSRPAGARARKARVNPSLSANKKWAQRAHFLLAKRECGRALRVRQIGRTAD